ncbi:MAG: helix-turn-helix transcriptional regulator [Lautropia sp.]|nr:helix-turn-helix transcriptional regulator [Lautropia sp.]
MAASDGTARGGREPIASPAALQAAREARGWSRLDVARQIKFQVRQIAALENGRFEDLPGHAFVRAALRGYGNLLDVDVSPLLSVLGGHAQPAELKGQLRHSAAARLADMEVEFEPAVTHSRRMNLAWGVGGVAVVVLLLGYFGGGASLGPAERWLRQVRQETPDGQLTPSQKPVVVPVGGQLPEPVRLPAGGSKAPAVSQSVASQPDGVADARAAAAAAASGQAASLTAGSSPEAPTTTPGGRR